ncbi:MAG: hypothetical protein ACRDNZ_19000 [Streptosporangiaceae bacterium]
MPPVPAGPAAAADLGPGDGALPRLFFPDEPAVPPPPPLPARHLPGSAPDSVPWQEPPPGSVPSSAQLQGSPLPPQEPGGPRGRQRPPRATAPPRIELRQRALAGAIFGLLSLLAISLTNEVRHALYLVAFSAAVAVVAIAAGASAAHRARREETARPHGSLAAIILGSASIALSALSLVAIIFATQLATYERCASNAPTAAARQTCEQTFLRAVRDHMNGTR